MGVYVKRAREREKALTNLFALVTERAFSKWNNTYEFINAFVSSNSSYLCQSKRPAIHS